MKRASRGKRKRSIAFFHSEGSVNFNPGLSSVITFLTDEGFDITYWYIESREIDATPRQRYTPKSLTLIKKKILAFCDKLVLPLEVKRILCRLFFGPFPLLVVGIDRNGMIYASRYANILSIPKALLSYEIYFRNECGYEYKREEITACKGLAFAVCQDPRRAKELSIENEIRPHNIINMPVSPIKPIQSTLAKAALKRELMIEQDYVAIFSGSFAKWTMIDQIMKALSHWPSNWALVLRGRARRDHIPELDIAHLSPNIYVDNTTNENNSLARLLKMADIGIAFYSPLPNSISAGQNIANIGLSSGKIATYLGYSLPIICNNIGLYSDLILEYNAGLVVNSPDCIAEALNSQTNESLEEMRTGAGKLFSEHIDANLYRHRIVSAFKHSFS